MTTSHNPPAPARRTAFLPSLLGLTIIAALAQAAFEQASTLRVAPHASAPSLPAHCPQTPHDHTSRHAC